MSKPSYHTYEYPDCKGIVVSGDIHGDFNLLVNKVCVQYQMRDTLVIVAGDCGFGFENKGYYENIVKRNAKRMNEANNWFVFIRGNHDNPAYFDGMTFKHKRFMAVPDYSILKAVGHTALCVGGAISVDRQYRIDAWQQKQKKIHKYTHTSLVEEALSPNYYWMNESPVFNESLLSSILSEQQIDVVVTHTAPSFCKLQNKSGLSQWTIGDGCLLDDVQDERKVFDSIYETLKSGDQPLKRWYYGHFHQSWYSFIDDVLFKMLDIMELSEIPQA